MLTCSPPPTLSPLLLFQSILASPLPLWRLILKRRGEGKTGGIRQYLMNYSKFPLARYKNMYFRHKTCFLLQFGDSFLCYRRGEEREGGGEGRRKRMSSLEIGDINSNSMGGGGRGKGKRTSRERKKKKKDWGKIEV